MSTNYNKALLINGRLISAINQALSPYKESTINGDIRCGIQENSGRDRVTHNSLIRSKYPSHVILILLFFLSIVLIPWEAVHAQAVTTPVKWHPGHYYTVMDHGKDSNWYMSMVYKELKATPALRGIQMRYTWAELESSPGNYNFNSIAKRLSELSAIGKRLVLMLETKTFGDTEKLVPDYLLTNSYERGVFAYQNSGIDHQRLNLKLWNPAVYARMAALIRALGDRFNSNPYFEGIGLTETALGQPVIPVTSNQLNTYYANLLNLQQQMRNSFPNTVTFQFANYPRPLLESFIPSLVEMGTGLGAPDVFLEDIQFLLPRNPKDVYHYFGPLSAIVPLTLSVRPYNYINTKGDGTGYEPTVIELFTFARDNLKANYIFWHRSSGYYEKVLEVLNWNAQKRMPSGGLEYACPSTFSSCVN